MSIRIGLVCVGITSILCGVISLSVPTARADCPSLFGTDLTYGAGHAPMDLAIGDLDGDGDADLAVANGGGDNVSVLLNNGDGTIRAFWRGVYGSHRNVTSIRDSPTVGYAFGAIGIALAQPVIERAGVPRRLAMIQHVLPIAIVTLAITGDPEESQKPEPAADTAPPAVQVVSLADSIDPLRDYFDQNINRLRFLALLSPT